MKENNVPGLQGVIVNNDRMIWEGHLGVKDKNSRQPVTPSTLFRVGSITKSITALAILRAVQDGKIDLEMNLEQNLPEAGLTNRWSKKNPIRLKHVIEHTAGLDGIHPRDFSLSDPDLTLQEAISSNNGSREARWQPGTRMAYSNMGPGIAALALEKVTGVKFEDYVQKEVFDVLGMNSATFFYDSAVSKSYGPDGNDYPYVHIGLKPSGAASLTTSDMAAFVRMFLNRSVTGGENFLPADLITRMETPTSTLNAGNGIKAGYGLASFLIQKDGFVYHGHTGGVDGFLASYAYLPSHNIGYFFSMNAGKAKAFEEIESAFHKFLTKDLVAGKKQESSPLNPSELQHLTGYYKPVAPRWKIMGALDLFFNTISLDVTAKGIATSSLLQPEPQNWIHVGNNKFRLKDDSLPSMMVHIIDDRQYLQTLTATYQKTSLVNILLHWGSAVAVLLVIFICWIYALFWGVKMLRRRYDSKREVLVRALPFLTSLLIPFGLFSLVAAMSDTTTFHLPTKAAFSYWIGSLVFAGMSLVSTVYVGMNRTITPQTGRLAWLHSLLVSLAMLLTVIYFSQYGFIGLQIWKY
ncbi:serine hydrolase domain-containing protein [Emcibacter sp.]|uniref:serine hydrolase domain-containing protein n=1 Tax=Emcibacter sp. TaxID=1979954 RepID=UPI002AA777F9|nr:serine hydrolase domain-containing protein [Emcibacter sp.]